MNETKSLSVEELRKRKIFLGTPMFGGQCYGTYTRSVIDLQRMCDKYGVGLYCYYLFNESLINRARSYIADEFMRSDATHLLFIDADIGFNPKDVFDMLVLDKEIMCAPYSKKCLHYDTEIETEDGFKTIKEIVETQYSKKVKSFDTKNKKVTWNRVINWWKEENKQQKKWIELKIGTNSRITLTTDHEIFVVEDRNFITKKSKDSLGKFVFNYEDEYNSYYYSLVNNYDMVKTDSYLYDIEVENEHNFFANGILVHNCVSWEKIYKVCNTDKKELKEKIQKNPNELQNYIGDFVFNVDDPNVNTIQINEPVKVAEGGTGFMMIHRSAFEKFREHFGSKYEYRPDHNRTEHFNGSRNITLFFHCDIDPNTKRYLSEDYWFCRRTKEAGCEIWLCPWIKTTHTGTMTFPGDLSKMAESENSYGGPQLGELKQSKKLKKPDNTVKKTTIPSVNKNKIPRKKSGLEM